MSISGDRILVASPRADSVEGDRAGAAYLFDRDGTSWTERQKLLSVDGGARDLLFGISVALSGDSALVGAASDDRNGIYPGSAILYGSDGTTWNEQAELVASDGVPGDLFGRFVSVSGGTAAVGAFSYDEFAPDLGAVYVFEITPMLTVELDIKPDGYPNRINPGSRGVIPVAILGSDAFDVAEIDVTTLAFGPDAAPIAHLNGHLQDVNCDGTTDLVTHFRTRNTGIACGDESATLIGETLDGQAIEGNDSIKTVGCRTTMRPAIWMNDQDTLKTSGRNGPIEIDRR